MVLEPFTEEAQISGLLPKGIKFGRGKEGFFIWVRFIDTGSTGLIMILWGFPKETTLGEGVNSRRTNL